MSLSIYLLLAQLRSLINRLFNKDLILPINTSLLMVSFCVFLCLFDAASAVKSSKKPLCTCVCSSLVFQTVFSAVNAPTIIITNKGE